MGDEALWFEPVSLLPRCSLNEGLLWVWAERLPLNTIFREVNVFDTLHDWECEKLGIPHVPDGIRRGAQYLTEHTLRRRSSEYQKMTTDVREYYVTQGMAEAEEVREWIPVVTDAMELPATELFMKLRRGEIEAQGKQLPEGVQILDFIEGQNSYSRNRFHDLADTPIPHARWTMRGIDWFSNALATNGECFCDVSLPVEDLMKLFPGDRRPIRGELVGDCILVKESAGEGVPQSGRRALGRPPTFAWDAFHVEVADLLKTGRMPQKKEAAIQLMLQWFESTQMQRPSRSAVSEKLTPYYRRFMFS
jgi:hypothetical protein